MRKWNLICKPQTGRQRSVVEGEKCTSPGPYLPSDVPERGGVAREEASNAQSANENPLFPRTLQSTFPRMIFLDLTTALRIDRAGTRLSSFTAVATNIQVTHPTSQNEGRKGPQFKPAPLTFNPMFWPHCLSKAFHEWQLIVRALATKYKYSQYTNGYRTIA